MRYLWLLFLFVSVAQAQVITRPGYNPLSGWVSAGGKIIQDATVGDNIEFNRSGTGVEFGAGDGAAGTIKGKCTVLSGTGAVTQTIANFFSTTLGYTAPIGYSYRITEAYTCNAPGCGTLRYGSSGFTNRYAENVAVALGTVGAKPFYGALEALDLVATMEGGGTVLTGQTRFCFWYWEFIPPTS